MPGLDKIVTGVLSKCISCRLAPRSNKLKIKGGNRRYQSSLIPNEILWGDVAYLPRSSLGNNFLFIIVDRATSYVSAIPLKQLNSSSTSTAAKTFSIMPRCKIFATDNCPEYGTLFTRTLAYMNIKH